MQPTANKLTIEQALHNIKVVVSHFKGTLVEHQTLQESLKVITETIGNQVIKIDDKDIVKEQLTK